MYAHYFTSKAGAELLISSTPALNTGNVETIRVSGKREARKIAAERNATCWNF